MSRGSRVDNGSEITLWRDRCPRAFPQPFSKARIFSTPTQSPPESLVACPPQSLSQRTGSIALLASSIILHHVPTGSFCAPFCPFPACTRHPCHLDCASSNAPFMEQARDPGNIRLAAARSRIPCSFHSPTVPRSEQDSVMHANEHQE